MLYLRYIAAELRRRRGRTILTALGLGVGVGLVVTVTALSAGLDDAQSEVLAPLTGVGTDMTVKRPVQIGASGQPGIGGPAAALAGREQAAAPRGGRPAADRLLGPRRPRRQVLDRPVRHRRPELPGRRGAAHRRRPTGVRGRLPRAHPRPDPPRGPGPGHLVELAVGRRHLRRPRAGIPRERRRPRRTDRLPADDGHRDRRGRDATSAWSRPSRSPTAASCARATAARPSSPRPTPTSTTSPSATG